MAHVLHYHNQSPESEIRLDQHQTSHHHIRVISCSFVKNYDNVTHEYGNNELFYPHRHIIEKNMLETCKTYTFC